MKEKINEFFKELTFDESSHKYKVSGVPIGKSVSKIVEEFAKPFDTKKFSELKARELGNTPEEVVKSWKEIAKKAADNGTAVHYFGELFMNDRHMEPQDGYQRAVVAFWRSVPNHVIPVMPELRMYHKEYFFAGTCDILLYNTITKTFIIGDYKTNKDLLKNFAGERLLPPFDNLLKNSLNMYQIQLSLYQILFEQTGNRVSGRKIIHLKDNGNFIVLDTEDYTRILKDKLRDDYRRNNSEG